MRGSPLFRAFLTCSNWVSQNLRLLLRALRFVTIALFNSLHFIRSAPHTGWKHPQRARLEAPNAAILRVCSLTSKKMTACSSMKSLKEQLLKQFQQNASWSKFCERNSDFFVRLFIWMSPQSLTPQNWTLLLFYESTSTKLGKSKTYLFGSCELSHFWSFAGHAFFANWKGQTLVFNSRLGSNLQQIKRENASESWFVHWLCFWEKAWQLTNSLLVT